MHSYREQVTAEHDAFCISHALQSHMENVADNSANTVPASIDEALEAACTLIAEGLANCYCRLASLVGEARISYLLNFSDDALAAMAQGGYYNDGTGELLTASLEEVAAVYAERKESAENWEAEYLATEVVGDPNSYSAIIASDTVGQPSYSLQVNGKNSEHGQWVTKWGIAYAVVRELQAAGVDADSNTGFIAAVVDSRETGNTVSTAGLEFSVILESDS